MLDSARPLPTDPIELHRIIAQLQTQLAEAERERVIQATRIEQLLETIELLRRKRFGPSADRIPESQLALFDEAELEALIGELARIAHQRPRPGVSGSLRMGFRLLIGGARATTSAAGAEKLAIGSIRARYEHEERVRPVARPYPPVALRDEHANGAVYGV